MSDLDLGSCRSDRGPYFGLDPGLITRITIDVQRVCEKYNNTMRPEYPARYARENRSILETTTYYNVKVNIALWFINIVFLLD